MRTTQLSSFNTGFSVANTWYNSMAVTVKRPFRGGLEVLGNYTWAHATDTSQVAGTFGTFYGGDTPLDPNNMRLENGPSDIDIRNRFTVSFVLPAHVPHGSRLASNVINGWGLSGSEIATSGEPVSLGLSGSRSSLVRPAPAATGTKAASSVAP